MNIINRLYKRSRRKIREDINEVSDLLDEYQQIDLFRMMDRKIGVL